MHAVVSTQQVVSITASLDEWAEWIATPEMFLTHIQNLAFEASKPEPSPNRKKTRSPKARTTITAQVSMTTCSECGKVFKTRGLRIHIAKAHPRPLPLDAGVAAG